MPRTTPLIKIENTRRLGGDVLLAGDVFDEACEEARRLERERGLVFIHPFDDEQVIAGQGTIGLELLEQVPDMEVLVVPIGGGGPKSSVKRTHADTTPHSNWPTQRSMKRCVWSFTGDLPLHAASGLCQSAPR